MFVNFFSRIKKQEEKKKKSLWEDYGKFARVTTGRREIIIGGYDAVTSREIVTTRGEKLLSALGYGPAADPKTPCAKVPWNIVIPKCWPSFRTAFFFTQNYTHDIVKSNIEITKLVISI
jgi:hypothetical protein